MKQQETYREQGKVKAVVYSAKSSEDRHGSIPSQIADCRRAAEAEGREIVAEYSDEAKSAYRGNRGPELARAREHAEELAAGGEGAELWVQHSDRLARGDGDQAQHLVELVLWSRKVGVRLMSVQDPQTFDTTGLVYAALMGDRNHEDSKRKSHSIRDGLKRRKARGQPLGPVPFGYRVAHEPDGSTRRVIDPAAKPTVERIFALLEAGAAPSDIARKLNAEGIVTGRGSSWSARQIRRMIASRCYRGEGVYEQIIDPELFDAVQVQLARQDPVRVTKRKGGRPTDQSYFLRGIGFCGSCGSALYTRTYPTRRLYVCRNVRSATGL